MRIRRRSCNGEIRMKRTVRYLGCVVGAPNGCKLGCIDGWPEGCEEGIIEGCLLGWLVGIMTGCAEGCARRGSSHFVCSKEEGKKIRGFLAFQLYNQMLTMINSRIRSVSKSGGESIT